MSEIEITIANETLHVRVVNHYEGVQVETKRPIERIVLRELPGQRGARVAAVEIEMFMGQDSFVLDLSDGIQGPTEDPRQGRTAPRPARVG